MKTENPFKPEIAEKIIFLLKNEGLDEFGASLHAAAVVCGFCPTTEQAVKLIKFVCAETDNADIVHGYFKQVDA